MADEEKFQYLLDKYVAGTCTSSEYDEFFSLLLSSDADDIVKKKIVADYYKKGAVKEGAIPPHIAQEIIRNIFDADKKVKQMVPLASSNRKVYRWLAAACVAALMVLGGFYFFNRNHTKGDKNNIAASGNQNEMITQKGAKSKVVLTDGTVVFLNADSKLSYGKDFNTQEREVTLSGEGFFDVTHDENRPFIIHTEKADIKVLGTAFNVKNYPKDVYMETSLLRGKIEVTLKDEAGKKIILNPSEKLIVSKANLLANNKMMKSDQRNLLSVTHITMKDSVAVETFWMHNKVAYINKPLHEITAELERLFNVNVVYKSENTKNYRYTIYAEDYDLKEVMQVLKLSGKINYTINKNEVIIE